jgi:hypothetical protein
MWHATQFTYWTRPTDVKQLFSFLNDHLIMLPDPTNQCKCRISNAAKMHSSSEQSTAA